MPEILTPHLLPRSVSPLEVVQAGRAFLGLRYQLGTASAQIGATGEMEGQTDCVGLWMLVFKQLELLPAEFDISLPYAIWRDTRENTMKRLLLHNFAPFPRAQMQIGDLIFCGAERHAAMCSAVTPDAKMIVAQNTLGPSQSRVLERLIDSSDAMRRVVYRLKNCTNLYQGGF